MLDLMLPYTLIDPDAAFSKAFITVGMHWAAYVVAVGALLGIVTGARQDLPTLSARRRENSLSTIQ